MESTLKVPFLPDSVTERWVLRSGDEEVGQLLEEIIDLYRSTPHATGNISAENVTAYSIFIGQLLNTISKTEDSTVKVNSLRLLSMLAVDCFDAFVIDKSQLDAIYLQIQILAQDSSRTVRKQTLHFAVTISSRAPFLLIGSYVIDLLEHSKQHQDLVLKIATFTMLQYHLNLFMEHEQHHKRHSEELSYLRTISVGVVHRLQRCQPRNGSITGGLSNGNVSDSSSASSDGYSGKSEAKKIFDAAIDALAAACMAYNHFVKGQNGSAENGSSNSTSGSTPHLILNTYLTDLETHANFRQRSYHSDNCGKSSNSSDDASGKASNGNSILSTATHRDVCNRLYTLEFNSMEEELLRPMMQDLLTGVSTQGKVVTHYQPSTSIPHTTAGEVLGSKGSDGSSRPTALSTDVNSMEESSKSIEAKRVNDGKDISNMRNSLSLLKKPAIRSCDSGDDIFSLNSSPSASFLSADGSRMGDYINAPRQIASSSSDSRPVVAGEVIGSPGRSSRKRVSRGRINPISLLKLEAGVRDTQYVSSGSNSGENSPSLNQILNSQSMDNSGSTHQSHSIASSPVSKGSRSHSFVDMRTVDETSPLELHLDRENSFSKGVMPRSSKYRSPSSIASSQNNSLGVGNSQLDSSENTELFSKENENGVSSTLEDSKSRTALRMPSLDHNAYVVADSDNESTPYVPIDSDGDSDLGAGPPPGLARQISNNRLQKTPSRRRLQNSAHHEETDVDSYAAEKNTSNGSNHHHVTTHHNALSDINKRRSVSALSPSPSGGSIATLEDGTYIPSSSVAARFRDSNDGLDESISSPGHARQMNRTPNRAERALQSHSAPRRIGGQRVRRRPDSESPVRPQKEGSDALLLPTPERHSPPNHSLWRETDGSSGDELTNHNKGRRSAGSDHQSVDSSGSSRLGRRNLSIACGEEEDGDDDNVVRDLGRERLPKLNLNNYHDAVTDADSSAAHPTHENGEHRLPGGIAAPKSKNETYDYLATEDIHPSKSPSQDFNKALSGLETQDWPDIFHTINTLRAIALHHPNLMVGSGVMHGMVMQIVKRVDNLRSSLAKNAIILLADMFQGLGKHMDPEVATIVPCLLKRSSESSIFLVESADATLQAMMENVTVYRSIAALTSHLNHRSPALRARLAVCLHALVVARSTEIVSSKEFDALKNALGKLVNERSPEARSHSRDTIRFMINNKIVTRNTMESVISSDQLEKILKDPYTPSVVGETMSMLSSLSRNRPGDASHNNSFHLQRGGSNSAMNSPAVKRLQSGRRSSAGREGFSSAAASPMTHDSSPRVGSGGGVFTPKRASAGRRRRSPDPSSENRQGDLRFDSYGGAYINHSTPVVSPRGNESDNGTPSSGQSKESAIQMRHSLPAVPNSPKPSSSNGLISSSFSTASGKGSPLRRSFLTNKTGSTNASGSSGSSGSAAASAVAAAAKRSMESNPELASLQDKLSATCVKSWMERKEAMTILTTLMINHYDVLRDAGKLSICIDSLLDRLQDGSAKVHMHALTCLERINDEEPFVLQHNLMNIIAPALLGSGGSSNKPISAKSLTLLRTLFDTVAPQQVAQFLCHTATHDKDKLRLSAIRLLADVMPVFCVDHDSVAMIVKKIIFPSVTKLLFTSNTKGDVRVNCVEVIKAMQKFLRGDKIWLWSDDPHQQEELKRITSNT